MPLVAFKKKGKVADKSFRKRELEEDTKVDAAVQEAAERQAEAGTEEKGDNEGSDGPPLQKRKLVGGGKGGITTSSSSSSGNGNDEGGVYVPYAANESSEQSYKGDAQVGHRQDQTDEDTDARARRERVVNEQREAGRDEEDGGYNGKTLYRGNGAYRSFIEKDETEAERKNKITGQGPIRAPAFLRATARFDYQPNICKDYKETGTCGFGDSCIFMHDRGDYKSGWQLDNDWDKEQAAKKKRLEEGLAAFGETKPPSGGEGEEEEEDLPFACFICRGDFKNPVVTTCGHYFCGKCIMEYGKGTANANKCPVCSKQTFGVFNIAKKLIKKIKERDQQKQSAASSTSTTSFDTGTTSSASSSIKRRGWEEVR